MSFPLSMKITSISLFIAVGVIACTSPKDAQKLGGLEAVPSPDCINVNQKGWFTTNEDTYEPVAHTNICHVGKKANGLIGRLESRNGNLGPNCNVAAAASSYSDTAAAQNVIGTIISANTDQINTWFNAPTGGDRWTTSGFLDYKTGIVVSEYLGKPGKNRNACAGNKAYTCLTSMKARVVLQKEGNACFVLTSYPS